MTSTSNGYVPVPRRIDFDGLVPEYSRAVTALNDAASREIERAAISAALSDIVRLRASQLNGCAYCVDMHAKSARNEGVSAQRVDAIAIWRDSSFFTAAERAALELTEEVTKLSETHVRETVVSEAIRNYGEDGTAALIALIITINVWNAIGVSTRCWAVPISTT